MRSVVPESDLVDATEVPFTLHRLNVIMSADTADPLEVEGVLNPASAWSKDGQLYLFPRVVAEGNVSRVSRAAVEVVDGVPVAVRRDGLVLEPDRPWEHGSHHGGVEDPRITWIPSLGIHVMTYVAFGPTGPRPVIAVSDDLTVWRRLGPIQFRYDDTWGTDLNLYPNKNVVFFPEVVRDPHGRASYALLHRPMWELSFVSPGEKATLPAGMTDGRPGIWISYVAALDAQADLSALTRPDGHRLVALPEHEWEDIKIGAGPPPVRIDEGWLLIYHGASGRLDGDSFTPQKHVRYAAGAMVLDADDPSKVILRSHRPLLSPETKDETSGVVANVVFPTAVEQVDGQHFVFYGMADTRIGVARLDRRVLP